MRLLRAAVARQLRLPPPVTRRIAVHRGVDVPMRDGVVLRADRYSPAGTTGVPTVLVRTPYPRGGPLRAVAGALAEQGFHVVVQSCRGTADSGGRFTPLAGEDADGVDTLRWLARQPWHDGRVCTFGPSYVGFTQWALAAEAGERLTAMVPMITASQFGDSTYAGGAFSLDAVLSWVTIVTAQRAVRPAERLANLVDLVRGQPRLRRGLAHPLLAEADRIATGGSVDFYQEWLRETDPAGGYWARRGHAGRLAGVRVPVFLVGGWYDIFLPWQLADHAALVEAGAKPLLTVGPWTHGSLDMYRTTMADAVTWMRTGGAGLDDRAPVRVHLGGADEWLDLPTWPPAARPTPWYLVPGGRLTRHHPPATGECRPDRFRYDPTDPTPAVGGPRLIGRLAGRRDNRVVEARPDVLTYTSQPLEHPVEVVGPVTATVYVRGSRPYYDVFVRLCDVDRAGASWNVCDGLTRVTPQRVAADPAGVRAVEVSLWPTAYRFRPGHRIRVLVAGGAHPRFARNPGTPAALGEPTELLPVDQAVLADPGHPSAIVLPVRG